MSSRARRPVFSLHRLKSIRLNAFIVMLYHKADSLLLTLSVVCVRDMFVESTLRSKGAFIIYLEGGL